MRQTQHADLGINPPFVKQFLSAVNQIRVIACTFRHETIDLNDCAVDWAALRSAHAAISKCTESNGAISLAFLCVLISRFNGRYKICSIILRSVIRVHIQLFYILYVRFSCIY